MTRSQETRLKKLEQARSARPRRYCFYFDEEAEAQAQATRKEKSTKGAASSLPTTPWVTGRAPVAAGCFPNAPASISCQSKTASGFCARAQKQGVVPERHEEGISLPPKSIAACRRQLTRTDRFQSCPLAFCAKSRHCIAKASTTNPIAAISTIPAIVSHILPPLVGRLSILYRANSFNYPGPGSLSCTTRMPCPQGDARPWPARNRSPVGRFRHLEVVHASNVVDNAVGAVGKKHIV